NSPYVQVSNLRRVFDVSKPWLNRLLEGGGKQYLKAVDGVSFDIAKGETFALVGESGSGKSTVARMVVGLLPPSEGEVTIAGVSMTSRAAAAERQKLRRRIQMIFQDPYASLNPRWRVDRIVAEPIRAFRLIEGEADIRARVGELLTLVGLHPDDGTKYPHEFSGGQRQRIAIARALALNPKLVVADEPVSALDVSIQSQVINLIVGLRERLGLSMLFISHDLSVIRHVSDRIAVMYLGRVVETGAAGELMEHPFHPYTKALLSAIPQPRAERRRERIILKGELPDPAHPPTGCAFHTRCPSAMPQCAVDRPALVPRRDGGTVRTVACHIYEPA
ncbi:MAG TPA: oligopeptide/dipeptide ABC transporter ATP-binding protein, partial [Microvirga sp.]|nr:oligopeptide/dipeptide ABC transporter ATP-binding protein [Microvirga sp.]